MGAILRALLCTVLLSAAIAAFAADGDPVEITGTVMKAAGGVVTIKMDNPPQLAAGSMVDVHVFFTREIFGMKTSGWLLAAEARLVSLNGSVATVKIIREKSPMMVNNKKVEHLTPGKKVKLAPR
jgi:hypothetical protein